MKPARSAVRWAMVVMGGKLNRAEVVILINQQSRGGQTYQSQNQNCRCYQAPDCIVDNGRHPGQAEAALDSEQPRVQPPDQPHLQRHYLERGKSYALNAHNNSNMNCFSLRPKKHSP